MADGLTTGKLRAAMARVADGLEESADELNSLDGALGDGDLGVTLVRGVKALRGELPGLPDDVGMALLKCAQSLVKVSASTYGTLLATGLMSAAKAAKGRTEVPWTEMSSLLEGAVEAMQKRGRASLGDKTVLDTIDAVRAAIEGLDSPVEMLDAAEDAVQSTLAEFRPRQSQTGRARIWGQKSIGLDDPGMVAFQRMVQKLR
ncbi:MAG: dihydroxyacetone kinase subunit L [Planctomycetota bacterium]|jgi:dihydroxyacetone kinase-like protein